MSEHVRREHRTVVAGDGSVGVPASFVASQGLHPGMKVVVRLTKEHLSTRLRVRGVSEDEVDRIADLQLEPREHIVEFLGAEGMVAARGRTHRRWRQWLASWR